MRQSNRRYCKYPLPKGLKVIHIGEDRWYIGKEKNIPGKGLHQMIYCGNQEYHVWGADVESLRGGYVDEYGNGGLVDRHGNKADQAKVKIYILTSILDDRSMWCFDLNIKPLGKKVKVIFENGTVKNLENFIDFGPVRIKRGEYEIYYEVKPVGYRIK